MIDLGLEYNLLEPATKSKNTPLLVMLHGYGSDENDLFSFATELNKSFLVVSLKAPIPLSFGGNAWYDINYSPDASKWTNVEQGLSSIQKITSAIEILQKHYEIKSSNTFLLGFSQGAILSYAISITNPLLVHKVVALSGYVDEKLLSNTEQSNKQLLDYFVSHGVQDAVIPVSWARNSKNFLLKNSLKHSYHEYNMGHGINPQSFNDFNKWLDNKLIKIS